MNQLLDFLQLLAISSILLIMAVQECAAEEETAKLRVMTFNIRYDNPSDGVNRWRNRRDAVAAIIRKNNVDIVGMQEVLKSQLEDLQQRLPDHKAYGVGRDDGRNKGEFSPTFFSNRRYALLDSGTFWLSETPETPGSKSWDAAITRIVSWLKLRDKTAGLEFFFFNTHLLLEIPR